MEFLKLVFQRIRALFTSNALERDMDREMRLHVDLLAQEYEQSGIPAEEAKRAARRRFGNLGRIKERGRDVRGAGILEDLRQDLVYAGRTSRRNPVFTAVIVLSLALGIGANTAIFSGINGLFIKTLPVEQPERLVRLKWAGRNDMAFRTWEWGNFPADASGRPLEQGVFSRHE